MASDAPPPVVPPAQLFPVRAAPCAAGEAHNVRLVPAIAWITSSQSSTGSEVRLVLNTGGSEPAKNALLSRGSTGSADEYVVDLRHVDPTARCEFDHSIEAGSLLPKIAFVIADLRKKLADGDASAAIAAIALPIDVDTPADPPPDSPEPSSDPPPDGVEILQTVRLVGDDDASGQS